MKDQKRIYLAVDLGAESGRVLAGGYDGSILSLEAVHRFPNTPLQTGDHWHWDVERLSYEIIHGLKLAGDKFGSTVRSIGIDTWGVDYGLIDFDGELINLPFCYRDERNNGRMEAAFQTVSRSDLYERTGIQFLPFNTLFQLTADRDHPAKPFVRADKLLFIPDIFNYRLTGRAVTEYSIASTSQCMNMRTGDWDTELFDKLAIPGHLFSRPLQPGSLLGPLTEEVATRCGLVDVDVVAVAAHDTGSAVVAVPAEGGNHAYLSSGTWSLLGVESSSPVISPDSLAYNFTNEGGACETIRTLSNIAGLWLVQECRRHWEEEGQSFDYSQLTTMAAKAPPFSAVIDPDDPAFLTPGEMPAKIEGFCERSGQDAPRGKGAIIRTALESLALKYRFVLERLEAVVGRRLAPLHIVGGGTQNELLSQMTADATGKTVVAGPVEATAIGNILMQLLAYGEIDGLPAGRALVRRSFETKTFHPVDHGTWNRTYEQHREIIAGRSRLNPPGS